MVGGGGDGYDLSESSSRRDNHGFDADSATAPMLLDEVREATKAARHTVPEQLAYDPENKSLYIMLENMKEMALQAEFGEKTDHDLRLV